MKCNNYNLNLNLYSYGYTLNFLKVKNKRKNLNHLINKHKNLNIKGIEFPVDTLFKSISNLEKFFEKYSSRYNFFICFDNIYNINLKVLNVLKKYKLKNIRIRMPQEGKTIYGGNKFLIKSIDKNLYELKKIVKKFKNYFLDNNLFFCIENHQDLHSKDIINIIEETGQDFVGINWDIGNSIACCETPDQFFNNSCEYVRNIHLKDYNVFLKNNNIRLSRCVFGTGYLKKINIKKYLKFKVSKSIELGAQISRICKTSNDQYWLSNKINNIEKNIFLNFIREMNNNIESLSDYERNIKKEDIENNEFSDFISSYNNIRQL